MMTEVLKRQGRNKGRGSSRKRLAWFGLSASSIKDQWSGLEGKDIEIHVQEKS